MNQDITTESDDPESTADHVITIRDCNSIGEALVSLRRSSLNIKYGPNGIGKSTIARALVLNAEGGDALQALLPFKYRQGEESTGPSVEGADKITNVLVFDEAYVSQFVFQAREVVKNSFEIFINTPEYRAGIAEIERIFNGLKGLFVENDALDKVIESFTVLRDAFTVTKTGAISKNSRGYKALGMGGKLTSIPKALRGYERFLHSEDPAGWITWQSKGTAYLEMSDNCPFCSVRDVDKKTVREVSSVYESAAVKNLSALRIVIRELGGFFAPEQLAKLEKITTTIGDPSPEQSQFLAGVRRQVETLLSKFTAFKEVSFHALRDVPDIDSTLRDMKIDLSLLEALDSEGTRPIVAHMNSELDRVAERINEVKARIGAQKTRVAKSIRANQAEINDFLTSAGYKYSVSIESSGASYRMILEHRDAPGHLEAATRHLSFGERNAFALVLFMHHVRRERPTLVVLDDPVSSFDKTKKFAILYKLFHGKVSLRGFTTLLLTHDIEPAIDIVRTATSGQFDSAAPIVHFLRGRGGYLVEKEILPSDIMTFSQVCDANIASSANDVIKCIYLRRRYEVHGDVGAEYEVLSSLLHLRKVPSRKDGHGSLVPIETAELEAAIASISRYVPGFDYQSILSELQDISVIRRMYNATEVGYEKVQLFRIALALNPGVPSGGAAFKKFVNESYHIENEYVMQLNPRDFDAVPEHIIEYCTALLE